jgi:hypothetical protein
MTGVHCVLLLYNDTGAGAGAYTDTDTGAGTGTQEFIERYADENKPVIFTHPDVRDGTWPGR